jgi:hypothetical protein
LFIPWWTNTCSFVTSDTVRISLALIPPHTGWNTMICAQLQPIVSTVSGWFNAAF